jgi:hypothetical protein
MDQVAIPLWAQLGIAAIFFGLYLKNDMEKEKLRQESRIEIARLNTSMIEMQTAHRREILSILKSFLIYPDEKPLPNRDFQLIPGDNAA